MIWAVVEQLPLSAFYQELKARGSTPGLMRRALLVQVVMGATPPVPPASAANGLVGGSISVQGRPRNRPRPNRPRYADVATAPPPVDGSRGGIVTVWVRGLASARSEPRRGGAR
jgi:hypothetical protein